ncbi:MAG: hypothetical protein GTO63_08525 [Anaerolineae bacterium]|nr:hypothetical protein [Anaerolineae bacterium]NIN96130.1 hypothetical protein [Anaerolineae bacterium]NIQ77991.1 hypothetical protein [Anaerolineae bacterium]
MNRKPSPDFGRFLTAVRREGEADRVPFGELFHDDEIMESIQGPQPTELEAAVEWRVRFWWDLGYDYVTIPTDIVFPTRELATDDTAALSRGKRGWVNESRRPSRLLGRLRALRVANREAVGISAA